MSWIGPYLPWVATAMGAVLILLGALMLYGSFSLGLSLETLAARMTQGNQHHSLKSYYLYGMGYAIGSLGCVFPIFFVWVIQPLLQGFVGGLANFVAYASGMALMMVALSIGAGAYLIYYNSSVIRF